MGRRAKPPSYLRFAKPDGSVHARCCLFRKTVYLGKYGSEESYERFKRIQARWQAAFAAGHTGTGRVSAGPAPAATEGFHRTVEELIARFWLYAEGRYRTAEGKPTKELINYRAALRPLRRLCGDLPVSEFGPRALREVRDAMASGSWMTDDEKAETRARGWKIGWCRRVVNRNLVRLRTFLRWCETEELLEESRVSSLCKVRGLELGEQAVRESPDRLPVPEADLAATLPRLRAVIRALVELQLLTAARPSELVKLTAADLRRDGRFQIGGQSVHIPGCWVYDPTEHKLAHKKIKRIILFGPRAQEVLAPFSERAENGAAHLFSPRETVASWRETQRQLRKTKVQPCQQKRKAKRDAWAAQRLRAPGSHYTVSSYAHAIAAACAKQPAITPWSPYRLRHNAATRLQEQFGWEVAQLVMGHCSPQTTAIYVTQTWKKAGAAVAEVG